MTFGSAINPTGATPPSPETATMNGTTTLQRPPPALEVSGLRTGYGRTVILRDFSIVVPAGQVTALLGPLAQAARVAKAAGSELGNLKSLSAQSASADPTDAYANYRSSSYRMLQMARSRGGWNGVDDDNPAEAMGVEPGTVKFNVTVIQ